MTLPLWMLLGFSTWTVVLLVTTVGNHRWSRILTGRAPISSFRADHVEGQDFYKRAMRAHANCGENLPVFGAVVLALFATGIDSPVVDTLVTVILIARVLQSLVHIALVQSDAVVAVRFTFFLTQIICCLWLVGIVVMQAA
jgi:uncharacterized MAPEG superfamily protein